MNVLQEIRTALKPARSKSTLVALLSLALAVSVAAAGAPLQVSATLVVNSADDTDDGLCDAAHCSLRESILTANTNPGPDTIAFDIPGAGPHTIQPASELPAITDPVTIDGTTQPGFAGAPLVYIDGRRGDGGPAGARGLVITAADSVVNGLRIFRFESHCVALTGSAATGNWIYGNDIGVCLTGIHIDGGASLNVIGTNGDGLTDNDERQFILGNWNGVVISGAGSNGNVIAGNSIGVGRDGFWGGSEINGVLLDVGAQSNLVGTNGDGIADEAERNVINGSRVGGVMLTGPDTNGNVVAGNFIGTDESGTSALENFVGVWIIGTNPDTGTFASPQFNRIGTDGDGIADEAERNVISGNAIGGVIIAGADADNNVVAGNFIGTDASGTAAVPNGFLEPPGSQAVAGVWITSNAMFNRIGTDGDGLADAAEGNLISGNVGSGVNITVSGANNVVAGNYIGTDVTGTLALPNGGNGVFLDAAAQFNTIGTNGDGVGDDAEGNLISGNNASGVYVTGVGTANNILAGNFIGMDATGNSPLANVAGITIDNGAADNRVGGTSSFEGNFISGNTAHGVGIGAFDTPSTRNQVQGNQIGGTLTNTVPPYIGNGTGIYISGATDNVIGGTTPGAGNVIINNGPHGILITGSQTTGNVIQGNLMGTDGTFDASGFPTLLPNALFDVFVTDSAHDNLIGGTDPGAGNTLIGGYDGTLVIESGTGNAVLANAIYSGGPASLGIDLGNDGVTPNDPGDGDSGANNLQNFPSLEPPRRDSVRGTLESTPNTTFRVEFFASRSCTFTGFGAGEVFLGASDVTTNKRGSARFRFDSAMPIPAGSFITATATDPFGNTSEFSECRQ